MAEIQVVYCQTDTSGLTQEDQERFKRNMDGLNSTPGGRDPSTYDPEGDEKERETIRQILERLRLKREK